MKQRVAILIAVVVLVLPGLAAFAGGAKEPAAAKGNLVLWATSLVTPAEAKLPKEQWYLTQAVSRFQAANPGVTVDIEFQGASNDTVPAMLSKLKAAALAKTGPDVINTWSGTYLFSVKDILLPLNGKIPAADTSALGSNWIAVTEGFQDGGAILAYPAIGTNMGFLLYNKKIVQAAGLDFESNPPRTPSAFDDAMRKIKATGITPIASDLGAQSDLIYFGSDYWWGQFTPVADRTKENSGQKKYADDKGLKLALTYLKSLNDNGFLNQDFLSSGDSKTRFLSGKAAILASGVWDLTDARNALGSDFGVIQLPDISDSAAFKGGQLGGCGESVAVSKFTKFPEAAVKLCSFLSSKSEQLFFLKGKLDYLPLRSEITATELGWGQDPILSKLLKWSPKTLFWVDNTVISNAMEVLTKEIPLYVAGQKSLEDVLADADKAVAQSK